LNDRAMNGPKFNAGRIEVGTGASLPNTWVMR
jgi:hypothetical protein